MQRSWNMRRGLTAGSKHVSTAWLVWGLGFVPSTSLVQGLNLKPKLAIIDAEKRRPGSSCADRVPKRFKIHYMAIQFYCKFCSYKKRETSHSVLLIECGANLA
jgi:hypothetical protein